MRRSKSDTDFSVTVIACSYVKRARRRPVLLFGNLVKLGGPDLRAGRSNEED